MSHNLTEYKGIDVSVYQGTIHFNRVAASGIRVVYIRAGEGSEYIDPYFERHYRKAKRANLKVGFYYFVTARTREEARSQATRFYDLIRNKSMDCRPAMDFEIFGSLTRDEINDIGYQFMRTLEDRLGYRPVIYSDSSRVDTLWKDIFTRFPLWIAQYGSRELDTGRWRDWAGFQYTDEGRIRGINGYVDRDDFRSTIFIS